MTRCPLPFSSFCRSILHFVPTPATSPSLVTESSVKEYEFVSPSGYSFTVLIAVPTEIFFGTMDVFERRNMLSLSSCVSLASLNEYLSSMVT